MNILTPIKRSYEVAKERGWDTLYWAIDVHGTIMPGNYKDNEAEFYPYAKETLKLLTDIPYIKLIFFTCSYQESVEKLSKKLYLENNIKFDYINENPEVENTTYGDYTKKFYFNVCLEDKAGFEPEVDWETIYDYMYKLHELAKDIRK
jgi:hypothetical protein